MKKVILLILDGFGLRDNDNGNAIKMASLPNITNVLSTYSVSQLDTSGEAGLRSLLCQIKGNFLKLRCFQVNFQHISVEKLSPAD